MAAILDISKRSRVRGPHPPGNLCLDPMFIESGEKKTLSKKFGSSPLTSRLTKTKVPVTIDLSAVKSCYEKNVSNS